MKSAISGVPGREYRTVVTAPPAASTNPVRIGGSVQPRAAIVIAARLCAWTIAPTSARRW